MVAQRVLSERGLAGGLLLLGFLFTFVGIMMWTGRNLWKWRAAEAAAYLTWERGFVIAGIVAALLGFTLLERMLSGAGDLAAARLGLVMLLVGAALGIAAEGKEISTGAWTYAWVVVYVVLTFLGQAAFGLSLLQTGLLAGWIGWFAIVWNLGWLVALPIVSPADIYYPVLHIVAPLVLGIALIASK